MAGPYPDELERRGIDPSSLVMNPGGTLVRPEADGGIPELPRVQESGLESWALEIGKTVGQGGMGVVRQGRQVSLDRTVAVKGIRADKDSENHRKQIYREAWVTGRLEHPNIVPVYTLGMDDAGRPAFVMRYVAGVSWSSVLDAPADFPELLIDKDPIDLHLSILDQVCRAVHFAHAQGILHRDLKPSNVMLGEYGEVYVLDWGLAVSLRDPPDPLRHAREIGTIEGTPAYMAPEMSIADGPRIGVWSDVFLLGAILHRILAGEKRYVGDTTFDRLELAYRCPPPVYDETVPEEVARIARCAMARDPADRYPSVEAFRRALVAYRDHRVSVELTAEATARAMDLHPDLGAAEIATRAAEARFGFEQALRVWPENEAAREGLNTLIVERVHRLLEQEDLGAATSWLALHPDPDPRLEEALQELRARLEAEESRLRALERDANVLLGARGRAVSSWVVGAIWASGTWGIGAAELGSSWEPGVGAMIWVEVAEIVAILAMLGATWSRQRSRSGRHQGVLSLIMAIGVTILTLAGWAMGLTVAEVVGIIAAHLAVMAGALALISVPSVIWCVPSFGLATLGVLFWPEGAWFLAGFAALLGFTVMGFAWLRAAHHREKT